MEQVTDNESVKALVELASPDILLADGFDNALVGVANVRGEEVALYDTAACLAKLIVEDGMSEQEALEFFEFNVVGAYVGPKTPVFAMIYRRVEFAEPDSDETTQTSQ